MTDTITLHGMRFEGRHGTTEMERALPQELEVDVDVEADLAAAAASDNLADTVNYGSVLELCRNVVEERSFHLLEAIAGAIAADVLATTTARAVTVRVRKLAVPVDADLDFAQVEIRRERNAGGATP